MCPCLSSAQPSPLVLLLRWLALPGKPREAEAVEADARLMTRLADGDAHALRLLFDRWKLPLLSYFYRAIGSHADAEDLVLQTLERIYHARERYRPESRFSTWLFAVARRELLHELRRRRRKPVEAVAPDELDMAHVNTDGLRARDLAEAEEHLLVALAQMPERDRTAILLSESGDLKNDEIAQVIAVSPNHFSVILHRARMKLRTLLQEIE